MSKTIARHWEARQAAEEKLKNAPLIAHTFLTGISFLVAAINRHAGQPENGDDTLTTQKPIFEQILRRHDDALYEKRAEYEIARDAFIRTGRQAREQQQKTS